MPKPWDRKPLWELIYMSNDKVHLRAAVIIGHRGCTPSEFDAKAKELPDYNEHRFRRAVEDLTVYATREAKPPRYELTALAKKAARVLLGPEPSDPTYAAWWKSRLISVRLMRAQGQAVEWADQPPVPLPEDTPAQEPAEDKQMKPARKARPRKKAAG